MCFDDEVLMLLKVFHISPRAKWQWQTVIYVNPISYIQTRGTTINHLKLMTFYAKEQWLYSKPLSDDWVSHPIPKGAIKPIFGLYPWSDLFGRDPPFMTIKVMSLIPATSHSVPNQSKECWRLQADDAIKSSDAIQPLHDCMTHLGLQGLSRGFPHHPI